MIIPSGLAEIMANATYTVVGGSKYAFFVNYILLLRDIPSVYLINWSMTYPQGKVGDSLGYRR